MQLGDLSSNTFYIAFFQGLLLLIQLTKSNAAIQVGARFHRFCELFQSLHIMYKVQSTQSTNNNNAFFFFLLSSFKQKIVAFENAFDRLLEIITEEGYSDGGEWRCNYGRKFLCHSIVWEVVTSKNFQHQFYLWQQFHEHNYTYRSVTNRVILMWKKCC